MTYSKLSSHSPMVFDETRNRVYLDAIRTHIRPDSVVLDLGSGLGVLGFLAAKAGARHVYCVEPAPIARRIMALAQANGIADRITVFRSRIEEIELPEQVDLIISVFTGNMLFTEGLLPSLYHARDRYLKPGGMMVPDRSRLMLQGVDALDLYRKRVDRYREPSLGIDYSSLGAAASNDQLWMSREMAKPVAMTPSVEVIHLDFMETHAEGVTFETEVAAIRDGVINGLLGWIEIKLGDAWLSTAPGQPDLHWSPALLPFAKPVAVLEGESLRLGYRSIDDQRVFWSIRKGDDQQKQSTVMDDQDLLIDMQLSAPECVAPLGEEGLLLADVLARIAGGESNRVIAEALLANYPKKFQSAADALKAVGRLAARHRHHPARKT